MDQHPRRAFRAILFTSLAIIVLAAVPMACLSGIQVISPNQNQAPATAVFVATVAPGAIQTQQAIPTATSLAVGQATQPANVIPSTGFQGSQVFVDLFQQVHGGVVSIIVNVNQGPYGQSGTAEGSGFLIDNQGHILTNNHVIANETQVIVVFYNGHQAEAKVVGADANSDLAVLKVTDIPQGAGPLPLGDSSKLQVGQWVVAIGNPFGVGTSMTSGIVSALGRVIPAGLTDFFIPQAIQTDAPINPGNSGGPLLTLNGEVIGVNAQIRTGGTNASAGVGFAIPSNTVRQVVPVLIQEGTYVWPWLGVYGGPVGIIGQQQLSLPTQNGALISQVVNGSPAAQAGLQQGDVITSADGQQLQNFDQLLGIIATKAPGDKMQLTVLRNGQQTQVTVTLGQRPASVPTPSNP